MSDSDSNDDGKTWISEIIGTVPGISDLAGSTSDDTVDRISHLYTVIIFIIFVIAVSSGQFFGSPIHCWFPAEFHDSYEGYTNDYCWIKNTYYIPMSDSIPDAIQDRESEEITYYQWIPLILLLQAMLFKIPNVFWRLLNDYSGVSLNRIIDLCNDTQTNTPEERQETIENLAKYLDKWLHTYHHTHGNVINRMKQRVSKFMCFVCSKRGGTYLTGLYLFTKLLYFGNAVGQLFMLNAFLSQDYSLYGVEFLDKVAKNEPMRESPRFPRVTLCDFRIRQMNNVQPWTVQCVLPINLFNEKIYVFIWFWLVFVSIVSGLSLIRWMITNIFKQDKVRYIKKYLKIQKQLNNRFEKNMCQDFAMNYLRSDGIFVLYMIARNSSEMVVTDLVLDLWKIYKAKNGNNNGRRDIDDMPDSMPPQDSEEKKPLTEIGFVPR